jgi:hypothetical protein
MKRKVDTNSPLDSDMPKKKICPLPLPHLPPEMWAAICEFLSSPKDLNGFAATSREMRELVIGLRFLWMQLQVSFEHACFGYSHNRTNWERNEVVVNHQLVRSTLLYEYLKRDEQYDPPPFLQLVMEFPLARPAFVYEDGRDRDCTYSMLARTAVGPDIEGATITRAPIRTDWRNLFSDEIHWRLEDDEEDDDDIDDDDITDRYGEYNPEAVDDWSWQFDLFNREKHGLEISQVVLELIYV